MGHFQGLSKNQGWTAQCHFTHQWQEGAATLPHGKAGNICLPQAPDPFSLQGTHFIKSFLQGSLMVGYCCTQVFLESTSEAVLNSIDSDLYFHKVHLRLGLWHLYLPTTVVTVIWHLISEAEINWSLLQEPVSATTVCAAEAPLPAPATATELCLRVQARNKRERSS